MSPVVTTHSDGTPVVAYALADSDGRMLAARDAQTVFYSASTVKLGVMLAAVLAAERGEHGPEPGEPGGLRGEVGGQRGEAGDRQGEREGTAGRGARGTSGLDAELECRHEFVCGNGAETFVLDPDDRDAGFPAAGSRASIGELVRMMIVRSSNEATNVLFDRLGAARVAEAFALCGAEHTRMQRRIGDPCAMRAGLTNETTAADLVAVMRCVATGERAGEYEGAGVAARVGAGADAEDGARAGANAGGAAITTPEHAEWMRGVLRGQEHVRIGSVVAPGVPWGSKSGDVPGIEHDVAYVGEGAARRYLAVCTRGFEPEQGREVIRAVAQVLLR